MTDLGKTLKVKVSFFDGDNVEETVESAATDVVVAKQENCDETDRPDHDWCAEMTVASNVSGSTTWWGYSSFSTNTGALDNATITYGGASIPVFVIHFVDSASNDTFELELNASVPSGTVFDLGGTGLTADSTSELSTGTYSWGVSTSPGWIEGQKVTVSANLAPIVTDATVDGDELVLTFAEDLDTSSVPAASAFSVDVDGTAAAPSSVDTVSGKTVTMTLASAVTVGQTVTVDYTVPTSNPLRDESELEAPAFTGQAVTNNTGTAPPPSGTTVWTATITVGSDAGIGYCTGAGADTCDYGSISDDEFTLDSVDYEVLSVRWGNKTDIADVKLHLTMDKSFPDASHSRLTLQVGDGIFALSSALRPSTDQPANDYRWTQITQAIFDLEDDDTVTVKLIDSGDTTPTNNAAEGQPGITGAPQSGRRLSATLGTVVDMEGLSNSTFPDDYTFKWFQDGTEIVGETGATLDVIDSHVGARLKVQIVSFTDDDGNAEGPLDSAETAAVVARQENCDETDRPDHDWCSEMMVGSTTSGSSTWYGFDSGFIGSYGTLDDTGIDYADDYVVSEISNVETVGSTWWLNIRLDAFVPLGSTFQIGGTALTANASSEQTTTGSYQWTLSTNPDWFVGQKVTVSANLAPIVTRARVNGDELVLTFTEDLDTNSKPAASAFSVDVAGTAAAPDSVDTISGKTVTMTLASAVTSGQTVTVDYTVPTSNPLQDESGLEAPAFSGRSVNNNTGVGNIAATGQPGIDGAPQVGQTLEATAGDMDDDNDLPTTTFPDGYSFQWIQLDADGTNPVDIGNATDDTYIIDATDLGKRLQVEVTFTDGANNEETLTSDGYPAHGYPTPMIGPAKTACPTDSNWCTTMTVGYFDGTSSDAYGFSANPTIGSLVKDDFDQGGTPVVLKNLYISDKTTNDEVFINFVNSAEVAEDSVFNLGGTEFTADAAASVVPGDYEWDVPSNFGWSEDQEVTVSLNLVPLLNTAVINGDELVLTYYEDLDAGSEPAASAFTVMVAGSAVTVSTVDVNGDEVTLTLATAATNGQTVTVSYAVPTNNPLEDASGLPAPAFTNEAVTNNTGVVNNPATGVALDGAAQVGMTLTALTADIEDADGLTNPTFTYQWRSGASDVAGATGSTYTVRPADIGKTVRVRVSFTDDAGFAEGPTKSTRRKVVPAASDNCDSFTVWCTTLTSGLFVEDGAIEEAGFSVAKSYGSLAPPTFTHRGVQYTVTLFAAGGTQDLYFRTTPNLPADGAGLTLHVQRVVGELSLPLTADKWDAHEEEWFFQGAVNTDVDDGDTFNDVPLLDARFSRNKVEPQPTEEGTEIAIRLSSDNHVATGKPTISGTAYDGETLSASTTGISDADGKTKADNGDSGYEYTYRWYTVDADGTSNKTLIAGATGATYTLTSSVVGKRVIVEASFTDDDGNPEGPLASNPWPSSGTVTEPPDLTAPSVTSASVTGDTLIIVFDENLAPAPNLDNSAFTVTKTPEGGSEETVTLSGTPAIDGATVTLTLAADVVSTDTDVKVSYARPSSGGGTGGGSGTGGGGSGGNRLADAAGNAVASFSGQPVTLNRDPVSTWYVYFDEAAYTATEGGAEAEVTVRLNAPWKPERNEALTVMLSGAELQGGASEADFSGLAGSVTFEPGQTAVSFTVQATDDNDDDDGERIRFGIAWRTYYDDRTGTSRFGVSASGSPDEELEDLKTGRGPDAVTVHLKDDDGVTPVKVSFAERTYTAVEGGADAVVKVLLDQAPGRRVEVPLTRKHTNAAFVDYEGVPDSVIFRADQTEKSFTVTAVDDDWDDDLGSITLGFGEPGDLDTFRGGEMPAGVTAGNPAKTTVNLEDNDGDEVMRTVGFGADTSTSPAEVREGITAGITVVLDEAPAGALNIPLEIEYTGGATSADVSGVPTSVTFEAGERRTQVNLTAVDDADIDAGEGFILRFGDLPAGVQVDDRKSEATYRIIDNDGFEVLRTVRFDTARTIVTEVVEGDTASIGVRLDKAPAGTLRIPLEIEYTGGASAADVTGVPTSVTFEAGRRRTQVDLTAVDDADVDPGEGFILGFGDLPTGVKVNDRYSEVTYTIIDGLPEIDIADATVREPYPGTEALLEFEVTLSVAYDERVEVDYETRDGTAKKGEDYERTKGTLTFSPGETTEQVFVTVHADRHDEGSETLTVVLTNPVNATLGDSTATGTITNTGQMPGAWLARFGRAASDASIEAIGRRMGDAPPDSHFTLGGGGLNRLRSLTGGLRGAFADTAAPDARFGDMNARERMDLPSGEAAGRDRDAHGAEAGDAAEPGSPGADADGGGLGPRRPEGTTGSGLGDFARLLGVPDPRGLLMGSSFFYSPGGGWAGPGWLGAWSAWGETSAQWFSGAGGGLDIDGELATATFGFDTQRDRWLAGLALSYTEAEGAYARGGVGGGAVTSTLASLNPYVRYELNGRTEVWGVLGYGAGGLSLTPERAGEALRTDLSHALAAFGGRTALAVYDGDAGRFELAARSDARLTSTASGTVDGLMGAAGATSRVRVLLEGSGTLNLASGGVLTPTLEAGLRYDGGDAETGAGLELGGGLGYSAGRLNVRVDARVLVAHQDREYGEWGFGGSLAYTPDADGRGLNLNLGSSWGATQSGVRALWSRETARGLAGNAPMRAGQRFDADIGYALAGPRGRALWTPYVGAQAADTGGRTLRLGLRMAAGDHAEADLQFGQQSNDRGEPGRAVSLGGSVRF